MVNFQGSFYTTSFQSVFERNYQCKHFALPSLYFCACVYHFCFASFLESNILVYSCNNRLCIIYIFNFISFLYEQVAGLILFPVLVLSIYAPFDSLKCLQIGFLLLVLFLLLKWFRMLYLGFFKSSFSKTHLFIYLCILEILPLAVIIKHFLL